MVSISNFPYPINDQLQIRFAVPEDAEALGSFNQRIHEENSENDTRLLAWTKDLLTGKYPKFNPQKHCTIVEDIKTKKIVSSMLVIPQTWSYAGIPFRVDRPELVGTLPEYRNKGLIRKQFEIFHQLGEQNGTQLLSITGIPYYYRMFGYEMAVNLGGSRKGMAPQQIPMLKNDQKETFFFVPATNEDAGLIEHLTREANQRSLLSCVRDYNDWIYEISEKHDQNINRTIFYIIKNEQNQSVGFLGTYINLSGSTFFANLFELNDLASWDEVTPAVLRFLWKTGQTMPAYPPQKCDSIGFAFGAEHPAYTVVKTNLPIIQAPYAWYIRVPHVADFLNHIKSILNNNLENSPFYNINRELTIGFYKSGLKLEIKQGKIVNIEELELPVWEKADAAFPPLVFLQLIFGYRNCTELKYAFPDCWFKPGCMEILDILFPKKASDIYGLC
jgi:hypothetical protein